ncbi:MAG TPA: hypothetical protein VK530_10490 [Candidatus Acidoferrum sp.]|nr:hypothetical protein [Candidatus Acidoferrum sp.]
MGLPTEPVWLDVPQVEELARHFSNYRHDVNGCLSLIVAATELIRYNPDVVKRMAATLVEQPPRIAGKTWEFALECERVLGIRPTNEPSWYRDTWKRNNAAPGEPATPATVSVETAKNLHGELLQLGKEVMQISFVIAGNKVLVEAEPSAAEDVALTAVEQLGKVTRKFDQFAQSLEQALNIDPPAPRRLASGSPSGPVTLTPDQVALFHRRLGNLQRDMADHLRPLLELSRLARTNPKEVQSRASTFAQQPPKISAELAAFATEFDDTFGIVRTA